MVFKSPVTFLFIAEAKKPGKHSLTGKEDFNFYHTVLNFVSQLPYGLRRDRCRSRAEQGLNAVPISRAEMGTFMHPERLRGLHVKQGLVLSALNEN